MSYIADCREDDYYNVERLESGDKSFVDGFDWCTEMAVDNFFDNIEDYFNEDSVLLQALNTQLPDRMRDRYEMEFTFSEGGEEREVETFGDLLRYEMLSYIESERNELIVSMIDKQEDEDEE